MWPRNCGRSLAPQGDDITGTSAGNNHQRKKQTTIKQVKAMSDRD